jgi:NADH:ubiquinone reductase (H+-translocating)
MQSLSRFGRYGACTSKGSLAQLFRSQRSPSWNRPSFKTPRSFHTLSRRTNATSSNRPQGLPRPPAQPLQFPPVRFLTTKALPSHKGPVVRFLYRTFAYTGLFFVACGGLVVAFFIYDATTYREADPQGECRVSEVALSPSRGGPKNLPIASTLLDDEATDEFAAQKDKPKLVILGTGWGNVALLKTLNPGDYHITVVSPVNYFLFTPMLPSATVGTLEFRSLVEPIRKIINRLRGHFLRAEAQSIEFSEKLVEVSQVDSNGNKQNFYLPYDKLVIGVGTYSFASNLFVWR